MTIAQGDLEKLAMWQILTKTNDALGGAASRGALLDEAKENWPRLIFEYAGLDGDAAQAVRAEVFGALAGKYQLVAAIGSHKSMDFGYAVDVYGYIKESRTFEMLKL